MFNNKLRLNPEKTEFIMSNATRVSTDTLTLNSEVEKATPVVRNLGVYMDYPSISMLRSQTSRKHAITTWVG